MEGSGEKGIVDCVVLATYKDAAAANKARVAMQGRLFSGRPVQCSVVSDVEDSAAAS